MTPSCAGARSSRSASPTQELGAHFLVRACVDQLAADGDHTIATEMEEISVKGLHYIDVRNDKGEMTKAALETKFKRIAVLPPVGEAKTLSSP